MTDLDLISRRRQEVTSLITEAQKTISALEQELRKLDIAEEVLRDLTGAERPSAGPSEQSHAPEDAGAKPAGLPSYREMILHAMKAMGPTLGVEPKDVRDQIAQTIWPEVPGDKIATNMWRMEAKGLLVKDQHGYRLPQKDEAPDLDAGEQSSEASLFQPPAQGREAVPGGGT